MQRAVLVRSELECVTRTTTRMMITQPDVNNNNDKKSQDIHRILSSPTDSFSKSISGLLWGWSAFVLFSEFTI